VLFCGCTGLVYTYLGHIFEYIGFFCRCIRLFCGCVVLFWSFTCVHWATLVSHLEYIGFFCRCVRLFCGCVVLFWSLHVFIGPLLFRICPQRLSAKSRGSSNEPNESTKKRYNLQKRPVKSEKGPCTFASVCKIVYIFENALQIFTRA